MHMDFIGIDVGTSGCKAAVISEDGITKKSARREYRMIKNENGWAVLSLSVIWNCVKDMLKELSAEAAEVKAMAVSSLGETIAFLDEEDHLLLDEGITYMDKRNQDVWKKLKQSVSEDELYQITGKTQPQIATVNQYNYWMKKEKRLFEKTKKILFIDSYIAYMLCGEAGIDYSTASNTLFFDINTYHWSEKLAQTFGIQTELFPQVSRAGSRLGRIRKKISIELGLPDDIEILTGCHDQISATVGAGVTESGDVILGEGSTETLNFLFSVDELQKMKSAVMPIEPFVEKGKYLSMQSRLMHGNCIKWFAANFGDSHDSLYRKECSNVYDKLNQKCAADSNGVIFLPYFSETYFTDIEYAMGSFIGMTTSTTVYQLYRAMLEGLACETRRMFRTLEQCGVNVNTVTAAGGASGSSVYMQIKADIIGKEIRTLSNTEAGINGLAILCATEKRCFSSLAEAAKQFVHPGQNFGVLKDEVIIPKRYEQISKAILTVYKKF